MGDISILIYRRYYPNCCNIVRQYGSFDMLATPRLQPVGVYQPDLDSVGGHWTDWRPVGGHQLLWLCVGGHQSNWLSVGGHLPNSEGLFNSAFWGHLSVWRLTDSLLKDGICQSCSVRLHVWHTDGFLRASSSLSVGWRASGWLMVCWRASDSPTVYRRVFASPTVYRRVSGRLMVCWRASPSPTVHWGTYGI